MHQENAHNASAQANDPAGPGEALPTRRVRSLYIELAVEIDADTYTQILTSNRNTIERVGALVNDALESAIGQTVPGFTREGAGKAAPALTLLSTVGVAKDALNQTFTKSMQAGEPLDYFLGTHRATLPGFAVRMTARDLGEHVRSVPTPVPSAPAPEPAQQQATLEA